MKKIIFYICFVVILMIIMPMFLNDQLKTEEVISKKVNEKFDYGEYSEIKLIHTDTGSIEKMDLDNYIIRSCCK